MIKMTRGGFVRLMVFGLGGATLGSALSSCGSTSSDDAGAGGGGGTGGGTAAGGGGGTATGCSATGAHDTLITNNHGHSVMVPKGDFSASGDRTYDIQGSATHTHSITLTEAHRSALVQGTTVTVTSTSGSAHTHDVTVSCA
jgi:hypothetical protein